MLVCIQYTDLILCDSNVSIHMQRLCNTESMSDDIAMHSNCRAANNDYDNLCQHL